MSGFRENYRRDLRTPMIKVLNYGNLIDGFRDYVGRSANRVFNEREKNFP